MLTTGTDGNTQTPLVQCAIIQPDRVRLRPYQLDVLDRIRRQIGSFGKKRIILQAVTGLGKTVCAAEIIRAATAKGKRSIFLVPRRELVQQSSEKLDAFGVPHGIILAGQPMCLSYPAQIASIDTLVSRVYRNSRIQLPPADVVVLDETHSVLAPTRYRMINDYTDRGAIVIGLTATPCRGDGRGLGHVYEAIECCLPATEATEQGYLVPAQYYAPTKPDLGDVKIKRGEYEQKQLGEVMDKPTLTGDIVSTWLSLAAGRQTVVFATNIAHSLHLRDAFVDAGIRAEHVDGTTPADERADILKRLKNSDTQVVCNACVLIEGFDCPPVSCITLARPTKSVVRFLQQIGRGLRPFPGKQNCVVLDHAGSVYEHGFHTDYDQWALDENRSIKDVRREKQLETGKEARGKVCEKCFTAFHGQPQCPSCGHANQRKGFDIEVEDGELGEVGKDKKVKAKKYTPEEKRIWFSMLKHHAREKGYADGWAWFKCRERCGSAPANTRQIQPMPPTPECLSWIKSQNIRAAKRREKEQRRAA